MKYANFNLGVITAIIALLFNSSTAGVSMSTFTDGVNTGQSTDACDSSPRLFEPSPSQTLEAPPMMAGQ